MSGMWGVDDCDVMCVGGIGEQRWVVRERAGMHCCDIWDSVGFGTRAKMARAKKRKWI